MHNRCTCQSARVGNQQTVPTGNAHSKTDKRTDDRDRPKALLPVDKTMVVKRDFYKDTTALAPAIRLHHAADDMM